VDEAVVAYFKVLSQWLSAEGTEESHGKPQSGQQVTRSSSNPGPS
jgi:hypothetical protein